LRIYFFRILAIGKIPFALPLSLPDMNLPFDFLIKHQYLSELTFLILILISFIPKDEIHKYLILFHLTFELPKKNILAYVEPRIQRSSSPSPPSYNVGLFDSDAVKFVSLHFSYRLAISNLPWASSQFYRFLRTGIFLILAS
jgi:hypothetical protein